MDISVNSKMHAIQCKIQNIPVKNKNNKYKKLIQYICDLFLQIFVEV